MHDGVIIGHAMAADRLRTPAEAPADRRRGCSGRPRRRPAPLRGPVTEIGVVVADACKARGGAALVRALIGRAQARA